MKRKMVAVATALALLSLAGIGSIAAAGDTGGSSRTEVSVLGGVQVLNQNDTALPDHFVNVPMVASVGYRLTSVLTAEGEFTWLVPLKQSVDLATGTSQDRKNPDVLAYQANLRADWPVSSSWSPYLAAGLGAVTFLSNTDADRLPLLAKSESMFALNFGAGASYAFSSRWGVRADFRELAAFPGNDAQGLSNTSGADPIWMERGTVGLAYRF
jgi:opacity protein-like surface antigen